MARKRDPKRDEAKRMFLESGGKITNREIARRLEVDERKIAVWKSRDKWNQELNGEIESGTTDRSTTTKNENKQSDIRSEHRKAVVDALNEAGTYSPALDLLIELYLDAYEEYVQLKDKGLSGDKDRKELANFLSQLGLDHKGIKPKRKQINETSKSEQNKQPTNNKLLEFRRKFAK